MKVSYETLINSIQVLNDLVKKPMPPKQAIKFYRISKAINNVLEPLRNYVNDARSRGESEVELEPVFGTDVELSCEKLSLDDFNFEVQPGAILALEWLIEDGADTQSN